MSGRVVVVTGASGGIGRAVTRALARAGDDVALLARGEVGLAAAAAEVHAAGRRALTIAVDTSDHEAVEAAADRVESELGPIDVWVNVAFTSVFAPFVEIRPEEYQRVTDVTYLGFVNGTRAALRVMRSRNRGVICQVGSALGHRGIPLQSAYCGAKHALEGFHDSIRTELMHDHSEIKTTVVEMPAVNTPQFSWVLSRLPHQAQPVPPIYQPEVAARAVLHAIDHPGRRARWVGLSTRLTIIGNRFVAGAIDRYLARAGYSSQQSKQPRDHDQPANLWEPADGADGKDFGAHGIFDHRAWQPSEVLRTRPADVARLGLGAAALIAPRALLRATGSGGDAGSAQVVRVLGLRYVVQSGLGLLHARPWVPQVDAAIDLVHAASMVAVATVSPRHRRLALTSAAAASGFAAADLSEPDPDHH